MKKYDLLILEDDLMIAGGLVYALEQEGYNVDHAKSIEEATQHILIKTYQLALLDMHLPDGLGTEIQQKIDPEKTKVIFLTVVDDEGNIVKAFEDGASDYVTKPFRLRELLARVKRLLLATDINEPSFLAVGGVRINSEAAKVYVDNKLVDLTALEYKLLLIFATNKGRVLTRERILDNLWDISGNFVEDNTLTVYIKRLRAKLGTSIKIETVRGIGYRVD